MELYLRSEPTHYGPAVFRTLQRSLSMSLHTEAVVKTESIHDGDHTACQAVHKDLILAVRKLRALTEAEPASRHVLHSRPETPDLCICIHMLCIDIYVYDCSHAMQDLKITILKLSLPPSKLTGISPTRA